MEGNSSIKMLPYGATECYIYEAIAQYVVVILHTTIIHINVVLEFQKCKAITIVAVTMLHIITILMYVAMDKCNIQSLLVF